MPKPINTSSKQPFTTRALELSKKFMHYSTPYWENHPPMRVDGAIMMHIMLLDGVMLRRTNRILEGHGLTFNQFIALGCIGHEEDGLTHSQLSQRLMISKTPVTSIVDRLEKMGLARRMADTSDRRVSHVLITEAGRERWQSVHQTLLANRPPASPLSEEEQLDLLDSLARLLDSVAKDDPFVTALRDAPTAPESGDELFATENEP